MESRVVNYRNSQNESREYALSILTVAAAAILVNVINFMVARSIHSIADTVPAGFIFAVLDFIVLGSLAGNSVAIYKVVPNIMIRPTADEEADERISEYANISRIRISGSDELRGFVISGTEKDSVLVYFGGIEDAAAKSAIRLNEQRISGKLAIDCDMAVIDWPEYGGSGGKASADSLKKAAVDVVRYFQDRYSTVTIMAYSMGTGYAVYAANVCGCDDLILISPYSDASDLVNSAVNVFHGVTKNLLTYKLPVASYANEIEITPMIFAGRNDKRVKYSASVKLAESFRNGSELVSIPGLTHGEMPESEDVLRAITARING